MYRGNINKLKGEIHSITITVGDFNISPTSMDRSSTQKTNKEASTLTNTLNHMTLIDIHSIFHPKGAGDILFSSVHGTISRLDHIVGHKMSFNKFKTEIVSSIFNHNAMKLNINYKKKMKTDKYVKIKQHTTEQPIG